MKEVAMSAGPAIGADIVPTDSPITERMISAYCRKRIAPHLQPVHTEALRKFLISSVDAGMKIPKYAGRYDWSAMGMLTNVPADRRVGAGRHIVPLLDAIGRSSFLDIYAKGRVGARGLVAAIRDGTKPSPDFADGWRAQQVVDAAIQSHIEMLWIDIC
jgi:hypothetical protein